MTEQQAGRPFDFAGLRDELDRAVAELEGRIERMGNIGDDITTRIYRRDITFFGLARGFADALAKDDRKGRMVVLKLERQRPPR